MSCYDIPHDPDDFGRCYRLLELFPDWKSQLGKVAERFPKWSPFVREWDTLTTMYEAALSSKSNLATEMYEFMQQLGAAEADVLALTVEVAELRRKLELDAYMNQPLSREAHKAADAIVKAYEQEKRERQA